MLARIQSNDNTLPLLVGVQAHIATVKINMAASSSENWESIYLKTQQYHF